MVFKAQGPWKAERAATATVCRPVRRKQSYTQSLVEPTPSYPSTCGIPVSSPITKATKGISFTRNIKRSVFKNPIR